MRIRKLTAALLTALFIGFGLAACGDDDDDGSGDSSEAAESGASVPGTGYSFALPEGWTDIAALGASAPEAFQQDLQVVDALATVDPEAEFGTEVNVVTAPIPEGTTLEEFAQVSKQSISDPATFPEGVTFDSPPTGPTETELGGEPAMELGHEGKFRGDGGSGAYLQRQLLAVHDGAAYVATFASYPAGPSAPASDEAAFDQIIGSWQWE